MQKELEKIGPGHGGLVAVRGETSLFDVSRIFPSFVVSPFRS